MASLLRSSETIFRTVTEEDIAYVRIGDIDDYGCRRNDAGTLVNIEVVPVNLLLPPSVRHADGSWPGLSASTTGRHEEVWTAADLQHGWTWSQNVDVLKQHLTPAPDGWYYKYFRCVSLPSGTTLPTGLALEQDNVPETGHTTIVITQEQTVEQAGTATSVSAVTNLEWAPHSIVRMKCKVFGKAGKRARKQAQQLSAGGGGGKGGGGKGGGGKGGSSSGKDGGEGGGGGGGSSSGKDGGEGSGSSSGNDGGGSGSGSSSGKDGDHDSAMPPVDRLVKALDTIMNAPVNMYLAEKVSGVFTVLENLEDELECMTDVAAQQAKSLGVVTKLKPQLFSIVRGFVRSRSFDQRNVQHCKLRNLMAKLAPRPSPVDVGATLNCAIKNLHTVTQAMGMNWGAATNVALRATTEFLRTPVATQVDADAVSPAHRPSQMPSQKQREMEFPNPTEEPVPSQTK